MEKAVTNKKIFTYKSVLETGEELDVSVTNTDGHITASVSSSVENGMYLNSYLFHADSIAKLKSIQRAAGDAIKILADGLAEAAKDGN